LLTWLTDTANPDDPHEISFNKGDPLDILDKNGKWWQARKADGTVGSKPNKFSSFTPEARINHNFSCTIQLSLSHLKSLVQVHAMTPTARIWESSSSRLSQIFFD